MATRRLLPILGGAGSAALASWSLWRPDTASADAANTGRELSVDNVPSRTEQYQRLMASKMENPFDVLVIGGGATGAGCAFDAQTRGLNTALIEREDFASGTSSRSTKLVHGGVRYLEKAVFNLDYGQLKLVYEALHERDRLLSNASHLAHPLPILTPCYNWWEVPYYWAGMKMYDLVAGTSTLVPSKFLTSLETLTYLPTMSKNMGGKSLKGSLACSSAAAGATVMNYTECKQLIKDDKGKVIGARCRDRATGAETDVYARVLINATGAFADDVRRYSEPDAQQTVMASSGAHVTLPDFYGSARTGMIIPKTKDGRVIFMLPFQGHVIAGTTDTPIKATSRPRSSEEDIDFILATLSDFLDVRVSRGDVLSTWCGIRPLPAPKKNTTTENVVRDHVIFEDKDGLLNVTGGKWTTYRAMAEQAIDMAMATGKLPKSAKPCQTASFKLLGATNYTYTLMAEIAQQHGMPQRYYGKNSNKERNNGGTSSVAMDTEIAHHLSTAYGDNAMRVIAMAEEEGLGKRLIAGHPILEAEVMYTAQHEYCMTIEDFIDRRSRLAFLDVKATEAALPRIAEIMGNTLGWNDKQRTSAVTAAVKHLQENFTSGPLVHPGPEAPAHPILAPEPMKPAATVAAA
ncbi:mitochondrial glycerol-3-phosphate dehydrogenase [Dunaliella salina]|uniref:Glycerol-3-phosphate dehydrogenase n=1 Tax=Dunaliella salina TaxID=3046 RepID=A0ABQ7GPU0_DUNSA|nr:mitochondrial glycerol-3-phosphate dehydrogenase [Dunaliella salina]|eukprot:KAF5836629.1 mitochondrial glycerol-3-phosphate dehydrogenase [Dunaliella salina]